MGFVYGQITTAPGGDGLGVVQVRGQLRLTFFDLRRFVEPWFTIEVGDWVALVPGNHQQWHALNLLGKGTPTAEPPA